MTYIHFGSNKYDPTKFEAVVDTGWIKPHGGLWVSKYKASKFPWWVWCSQNNYTRCEKKNSFQIKLKPSARIFVINSCEDLDKLPQHTENIYRIFAMSEQVLIDWKKLMKDYDAVEFNLSNDWGLNRKLYGWDCDCVFIMNKDIIEEVDTDE